MTRPGLIVGLGGTGQWVLTYLKRDLLLSNNGRMPDNVRLLAIDTASTLEAGAAQIAGEEQAVVGGVTLDPTEFIYVGGDALKLAQAVKKGEYPQIGQWYQAPRWLATQSPATFILDDGAGRLRQFGRLAVFKDLIQKSGSEIYNALKTNLEELMQAGEDRRLEIIVVGSFTGGTGSGMFIDIALLLRELALEKEGEQTQHHVLRGFFALPSVFTSSPDDEMLARTFASWRELNRFMVIDPDFPMSRVDYVEKNSRFQIVPDNRLFDACYLVDGSRKGQSLGREARRTVFPMMAESISAFLDEKAGTAYTQYIYTNLAPKYASRAYLPMYSAIGAYTVQVPAYYVQEASSHHFAQSILKSVLAPRSEPDEAGRLVAAGAERHLTLAARDQNREDRGFTGRQRSLRLLAEGVDRGRETVRPTAFFGRLAELYGLAIDSNKRAGIVDQLARAGGADVKSAAGAAGWLAYFPNLGDDPDFQADRRTVEEQMRYNVKTQYEGRDGEKEEERRARFAKIPEDIRKRYGGFSNSGEEIEEYYGEVGDVLTKVERLQTRVFRRLIRLHLLDILMGRSEDPIIARSGKLGYAWDYLEGAVDVCDKLLALMDDVKHLRNEIKPELRIEGLSERAKSFVAATAGKKLLWFIEHPDVKGSELHFLAAQQRLIEIRREDILHSYVVNTIREMKAMLIKSRDEVQRWIWHLSTGDDASKLPGMWDGVRASLKAVNDAHSFDKEADKVQSLVADKPMECSEDDLKTALRCWEWVVEFVDDKPVIKVALAGRTVEDKGVVLTDPALEPSDELRATQANLNQTALMGLARQRFVGLAVRTNVAEEIKLKYPDVTNFASEVAANSAEPFFMGRMDSEPQVRSNLIRVMVAAKDSYFTGPDGLEGEVRALNQLPRGGKVRDDYPIQVVGSENPYKLTMVRTDDLYAYDGFAAWKDCLDAYAVHMEGGEKLDPVLMQNFAAEERAVELERRLVSSEGGKRVTYRPLHPRVVMLLENPDALMQFVYLGMMDMIHEETEEQPYRWELVWEKSNGPQRIWLTRGYNENTDVANFQKPDIFSAIHGYVIRRTTQEPGRRDEIDYEYAGIVIDKRVKEMGLDAEIEMLEINLKEGGIVESLRSFAYDNDVQTRVVREDFADLATVIELKLKDKLKLLKAKKSGKRSLFATARS